MKSIIVAACLLFAGCAHAHSGHHDHGGNKTMNHLSFANGTIHAHTTWESGPQVSDESRLRLEWKNGKDHSPFEEAIAFDVALWMPAMKHGSAPTEISPIQDSPGAFLVSSIHFLMGGDWQVNITLRKPDGSSETQSIDISLPEEGGHH